MGVKGLSTYLEKYCEYYQLSNTLVIIDGGLSVSMGLSANYDARFGGNYKEIYNETCTIFNRFLKCNITPIVVDDGRFKDVKSDTMRKRYNNKLKNAIAYKNGHFDLKRNANVIALLYINPFRQALNDLNIPYCSTEFEADEEMMELARKLNCPILSQDSDFYLCDGVTFIPWDSIEFNKNQTQPYLACWKFERQKFLNFKQVHPSVFPFLSVLFSSDYSKQNLSEKLFPRTQKNEIFERAMIWLRNKTVEEVMEELILTCLPRYASQETVQKFRDRINATVNSYKDCKTTVIPVLEKNERIRPYLRNVRFDVQENDVNRKFNVPSSIINKIKECKLTSTILDFFVCQEFECKTVACEDVDEESAHAPSIRLIQGIYGILLPYLPEKPFMSLLNRNLRQLESQELRPLILKNEDPYKVLYEIMEINEDFIKDITVFDDKWLVFILTLIYWRNKCRDRINEYHIHSVILAAFSCHLLEIYNSKFQQNDHHDFPLNNFYSLRKDDYEGFVNSNIKRKWNIRKGNKIRLDDISHIHRYLSFQTCLHRSQPLFPLLDLPQEIIVSHFICGDYYHSIYTEMILYRNSREYIDQLFSGFDQLKHLYYLIISNKAIADLFKN